jgi:transcriptional regulator with XRE-family HTH domain
VNVDDAHIGRRVREIRTWRGLSLTATAGLAGITHSYLSMIERGQRPVNKRSLLEALANALRVSPDRLTGKPYAPSDEASKKLPAAISELSDVLSGWRVGEIPDGPGRSWPEIQADLELLNGTLFPTSDYIAQAAMLPSLIRDLLTATTNPDTRHIAMVGLFDAYHAATYVAHDLGFPGLPMLAVERMRHAAEELGDGQLCALASWARAQILNGSDRVRQYDLASTVADDQAGPLEVRGMANLTAALACAAQRQDELTETHLTEAASIAEQIGMDVSPRVPSLNFGRTNVGIWRVALAVELGQGARVLEIASTVRLENVSRARQAAFWIDYGRGLLTERKHHERGLGALMKAEQLAPQQVRNNVFAREVVGDLLRAARREAGGRDLRGLAYRMGIAP